MNFSKSSLSRETYFLLFHHIALPLPTITLAVWPSFLAMWLFAGMRWKAVREATGKEGDVTKKICAHQEEEAWYVLGIAKSGSFGSKDLRTDTGLRDCEGEVKSWIFNLVKQ